MIIKIANNEYLVAFNSDYEPHYEFVRDALMTDKFSALNAVSNEEIKSDPQSYKDLACDLIERRSVIVRIVD